MKTFAACLMAATCLATAGVPAAQVEPVAASPSATPFKIGKLEAVSLLDGEFAAPNDGSILGADVGPAAVAEVLTAAGAPSDVIHLSVNALLVHDGGRVVLLDTGLGPKAHGLLMQSLAKTGVAAAAVTDVLITHSHGDHIGGLLDADGRSAFPKAAVRMSSAEWAYMQSQSDLAPLVKTITAQVKTFEPGTAPVPGITAIAIKGHTPGHMAYQIVSGDARILDIGDSAHSSIVSLAKPGWAMGFDGDRVVAKASREHLLADLSKSQEKVFSPHFPYPGVGTVKAVGDHFAWEPTLAAGH